MNCVISQSSFQESAKITMDGNQQLNTHRTKPRYRQALLGLGELTERAQWHVHGGGARALDIDGTAPFFRSSAMHDILVFCTLRCTSAGMNSSCQLLRFLFHNSHHSWMDEHGLASAQRVTTPNLRSTANLCPLSRFVYI